MKFSAFFGSRKSSKKDRKVEPCAPKSCKEGEVNPQNIRKEDSGDEMNFFSRSLSVVRRRTQSVGRSRREKVVTQKRLLEEKREEMDKVLMQEALLKLKEFQGCSLVDTKRTLV
ncbi:hypothetical protein QR680_008918 [Steinernema hermaphroditum]|uniref:Uncharacterized protein n=1 Tax=Steinernema hermaphroditum TaxID=289476 RepID=A0AA39M8I6_9BILA|nr:hypothetical protein QR680_008918 [Steinernema hermaphroditum]